MSKRTIYIPILTNQDDPSDYMVCDAYASQDAAIAAGNREKAEFELEEGGYPVEVSIEIRYIIE